jgi:asparaginyl-tRNA synthetase
MSTPSPSPIVPIHEAPVYVGQPVSVLGFVQSIRSGKKLSFIELRYGKDQIQVVTPTSTLPALTVCSYVKVTGTSRQLPEGKFSALPVELSDSTVTVLSLAAEDTSGKCPPGSHIDVQLRERHHYFRDPEFARVMRLSDALAQSIRTHFKSKRCSEIIPPSFTGVECEGGATLFKLDHPGKSTTVPVSAYLTQSSQFALEMMLPGLGDCFCIAPSFRAEHSQTRRHLTEFTHVESEWGGVMDFEKHLDHLTQLLQGTIRYFLEFGKDDLIAAGKYERVQQLFEMTKDILILEHKEAIDLLKKHEITKDDGGYFSERDDIPEAQERKLIDTLDKIVFLVKFPKEFKSFYMALDPEDPSRVLGCDVEVPGVGEIIGSGVREADPARLKERMLECKLRPEDYSEYLDLRTSGFAQTSGMGLGLGRMLCWLLGISSIREVTAFPRFPGYLRP